MKKFVKSLSVILAIITLVTSSQSVMIVSAVSETKAKEERIFTVMENKISQLEIANTELHPEEDIQVTISDTKKIYDMDDNVYTLTECYPTGYMIFHEKSGVFVESSLKTESPYSGLENDLYYFGIGEYYQKVDDMYVHTIFEKNIPVENNDTLTEISQEINNELIENKDSSVVSYINGNTNLLSDNNTMVASASATTTYKGMTCVNGYKFFTLMKGCGNNVDGTCGYIAAGMLLSYYQRYYGGNLVDKKYLTYTVNSNGDYEYSINDELHKTLVNYGYSLGYGNSTYSARIKNVIKTYLKDRGIEKEYKSGIIPFKNNYSIRKSLESGHPVIWFGNIKNNSFDSRKNLAHAIIVYGYSGMYSNREYIAHFGWKGANEVYFSGVLGSMFAFTSNTWTNI